MIRLSLFFFIILIIYLSPLIGLFGFLVSLVNGYIFLAIPLSLIIFLLIIILTLMSAMILYYILIQIFKKIEYSQSAKLLIDTSYHKLKNILKILEKNLGEKAFLKIEPFVKVQVSYGQYIFSLFLNLLAGYGYKPVRSLITYIITIFVFASLYYIFGQGLPTPISPLGALVLSLTSFHGRGFFPGLNTSSKLGGNIAIDQPLIVLAAVEAVIGLIIEISFIATFTQRYFNK
jgi:hypothetical protein